MNPLVWITALSMTDEIPSAIVTYVAVLILLQFGASLEMASLCSGLLFLPWVLKSFFRSRVRSRGHYKMWLHVTEALMLASLSALAYYVYVSAVQPWVLFAILFAIAFLCAWHTLLARMYYNRMLRPLQQNIYDSQRMLASQSVVVLTYGLLIILAGFLEVYLRSYRKAWSLSGAMVAFVFAIPMIVGWLTLLKPQAAHSSIGEKRETRRPTTLTGTFRQEMHIFDRMRHRPHFILLATASFFLLLPQSLLFFGRVFYLLASVKTGGLGCSIQDIGFAQGTVGVLAFSLGAVIGRTMSSAMTTTRGFRLFVFSLTLSPLFYLLMSLFPRPCDMLMLCCMTFLAQMCFGFGLNIMLLFARKMSDQRYDNIITLLSMPLVSASMLLPMMASGWMVAQLGYRHYFLLATLCGPLAWAILRTFNIKEKLSK